MRSLQKANTPATTPTMNFKSGIPDLTKKSSKQSYSYLPRRALRWKRVAFNSYAAEPDGCSYIVHRSPKKDGMGFAYWFASYKKNDDTDAILLGDAFMNMGEAMEVCEAWEHERIKTLTLPS